MKDFSVKYEEVSKDIINFTKSIKKLIKCTNDDFVNYKTDLCFETNDFKYFLNTNIAFIVEDKIGNMYMLYDNSSRYIKAIVKFLQNYDLIYFENNKISVSKSNNKEAAKILKKYI